MRTHIRETGEGQLRDVLQRDWNVPRVDASFLAGIKAMRSMKIDKSPMATPTEQEWDDYHADETARGYLEMSR